MTVNDHADSETEPCFVEAVASLPTATQTAEAVRRGDRAFDDEAEDSDPSTVDLARNGRDFDEQEQHVGDMRDPDPAVSG
ncbi:hypothetical protein ACIP10_36350 [Streptomyces galbus]|uniref:hypothetical protein n=1 Tax=Streptomyces galbus TaxID=33898 RepID=UPI0037FF132E